MDNVDLAEFAKPRVYTYTPEQAVAKEAGVLALLFRCEIARLHYELFPELRREL